LSTNGKGKFYSVGAGPGDPKLLTVLAIETIKNCDIIAVPDSGAAENAVLKITDAYLEGKKIVQCPMAMTRDKAELLRCHEISTMMLSDYLEQGLDVAFLTLGDPTIYSTTMYVHKKLKKMGYDTHVVSGVPSFCAVAATLDIPLCEGGEALHVIPASYGGTADALEFSGNKVLMKSGKSICKIKDKIDTERFDAMAVERCGMEGQRIHYSLDTIDENSSYFSVLIVKEKTND